MELQFFADPSEFLAVAGDRLAQQPVVCSVMAGVAERMATDLAVGIPWAEGVPCWFVTIRHEGEVVSAAMRTARFGDHPAFLLPMADAAARLLAQTLLARGEQVLGANGAIPAVQVFCDEMAAATGLRVVVGQHTRLFELRELIEPRPVAGRLRPATVAEQPLVTSWYDAFMLDADEQAGRAPGTSPHETPSPEDMRQRIDAGRVHVWEDGSGEAVNVTAASAPAYGVSRIGPVYTPRAQRGRGYASAAVAEVSRMILAKGARACLFTDQANPTSNKIYEAVGFRQVVDMANLRVE